MPTEVDIALKDWATPRQAEYIDAINAHGGYRAAAKALGASQGSISDAIKAVKKKAARGGYAPGHFEHGTAPGYLMGKVTVQRGRGGEVERTWERQSPDAARWQEVLQAAAAAMAEDIPRLAPVPRPFTTGDNALCNLFTITDAHVGMLAWHKEGGADWDLGIAEETLVGAFSQMVAGAPRARVAVVNQLGDYLHFDGLEAVTPTNRHTLDADGRFRKVIGVAVRILRRVVDLALATHDEVHVIIAEGNHDLASSAWLQAMFAALYENEPRVTVNDSALPFYAYRHGKTLLGFHHGHTRGKESLPLMFAQQFRSLWGDTIHTYLHTGHRHHAEEKDVMGVRLVEHATLAARDAYASRHGYHAARQAVAITYHEEHGEVARATVTPGMLH